MRNPTNLLTVFTLFCIVILLQGCAFDQLNNRRSALAEGREYFLSKARQCVAATQVTAYRKFPVVDKRVYVFEESIKYEPYESDGIVREEKNCEVKLDPVLGTFPISKTCKPKKKEPKDILLRPPTIKVSHIMQCVAKNVDLNHNKRLLEVQRCLENSCMQAFEGENWWPSDRPMNNEYLPNEESWAIAQLAECIGCPYSQAELLAEGGHDPDFVARKLEAFNSSPVSYNFGPTSHLMIDGSWREDDVRARFKSSSPFERKDQIVFFKLPPLNKPVVVESYGMIPFHLFNSAEAESYDRSALGRTPTDISPLREIIFCDPIIPSESFYLVDTPVLVDDSD